MTIEVEKKDHIAYITLNRPEARNALDLGTVKALAEAWEDFRDDSSMRRTISDSLPCDRNIRVIRPGCALQNSSTSTDFCADSYSAPSTDEAHLQVSLSAWEQSICEFEHRN